MMNDKDFCDLKVLYLEDEALIAFDTSQHLEELGFGVVTCTYRLSEAEDAASRQHYDLAIFDINVGASQTSIALGEELASRGTKVIFASGSTLETEHMSAKGYRKIGKPFTLERLTSEVEAALYAAA